MQRRGFLRLASLGLSGLLLPPPVRAEPVSAKARHCIYIFLCGGPSQGDLWDLKPGAPDGIRSVFAPIATSVPGIQFSELIPRVAQHADKLAVIRSLTHDDNSHDQGIARTLLGQLPASRNDVHGARFDHPGLGAVLHRLRGECGDLPPWVVLPRPFTTGGPPYKGQSAGFLGGKYDPIALDKEKLESLSDRPVKLDAIALQEGMSRNRLQTRRSLLQAFDASARQVPSSYDDASLDQSVNKCYQLLQSGAGHQAFDLEQESVAVRERYGRNEYGQSFLLARRLIEAGVRVVNVFWTFFDAKGCQFNLWDNHGVAMDVCGVDGQLTGIKQLTHDYCCPSFDRSFSALLEDLHQRGLLDETLVAVAGEFGRTPRINAWAGRDHWAPCYTQLLAGGGIRGGQVYGASDATGAYVKDLPVSPDDFAATIYHAFGHAAEETIHDHLQRPHRISPGSPLTRLF